MLLPVMLISSVYQVRRSVARSSCMSFDNIYNSKEQTPGHSKTTTEYGTVVTWVFGKVVLEQIAICDFPITIDHYMT